MPSENVLYPEGIWLSKILSNLFFKKCNQTPVFSKFGHAVNTDPFCAPSPLPLPPPPQLFVSTEFDWLYFISY